MKLRKSGKDCHACFLKDCDCECKTCVAARERNRELSQNVLDILNIADAMTHIEVIDEKEPINHDDK